MNAIYLVSMSGTDLFSHIFLNFYGELRTNDSYFSDADFSMIQHFSSQQACNRVQFFVFKNFFFNFFSEFSEMK